MNILYLQEFIGSSGNHFAVLDETIKDINNELDYLKELSKLAVVRTCDEMALYGIDKSGFYLVDPDGPLMGGKPITVYCEFIDGLSSTKISHDSEEKTRIQHCDGPGCYSRNITYDNPMTQIISLIEHSDTCSQELKYECYFAPLQYQGVDLGYWLDKNGDKQIYWTGANYGRHFCSCHFEEEGCFGQQTYGNNCNCDSSAASELSDVGIITNSTALPITELRFGGLRFESQTAFHILGKVSCSGKKYLKPKPSSGEN